MAPVNQGSNRTFESRLADFGPEMSDFLRMAWTQRATIDLQDADDGIERLYAMYSGPAARARPYDLGQMERFAAAMQRIGAGKRTWVQEVLGVDSFGDLDRPTVRAHGHDLWTTFYHVVAAGAPTKRVYVHCADIDAGLTVMSAAVGWMSAIPGFASIKICGPGAIERNDTIVAYVGGGAAQTALVQRLQQLVQGQPRLLADGLPSLVRRVERGLGTSDEPPEIEVMKGGGTRHSFGSLYATLIWIALKTTPQVDQAAADGRHFLDNMLYILRTLQVEPGEPQQFPARQALEALQAQHQI